VLRKLEALRKGQITIDDGVVTALGEPSGNGTTPATITVHDQRAYTRMMWAGTTGLAEAYIMGLWDADDLVKAARTVIANSAVYEHIDSGAAWISERISSLLHRFNKNTPRGSVKNIVSHYDLGNAFFSIFLDDTMAYSSGIFEHEGATLREASIAKFDHICRKLRLRDTHHVLEIGTGWGGFAIHAAREYGCRVTTTTISREQFVYATERVKKAGLSDRVTVIAKDYRELDGQYDRLVSIEMIEAVGDAFLDSFFAKCGSLLKPNGMLALQAITISDDRYAQHKGSGSFINRYIFPGSHLLSVSKICDGIASQTDMHLCNIEDITLHYARTLQLWRERFEKNLDRVRSLGMSDAFIRMWIFYLAFCEAGFAERWLGDLQFVFSKPASKVDALILKGCEA